MIQVQDHESNSDYKHTHPHTHTQKQTHISTHSLLQKNTHTHTRTHTLRTPCTFLLTTNPRQQYNSTLEQYRALHCHPYSLTFSSMHSSICWIPHESRTEYAGSPSGIIRHSQTTSPCMLATRKTLKPCYDSWERFRSGLSAPMMFLCCSFASASFTFRSPLSLSVDHLKSKLYTIRRASLITTPSGHLPQKRFMKKDTGSRLYCLS